MKQAKQIFKIMAFTKIERRHSPQVTLEFRWQDYEFLVDERYEHPLY